MEWNKHFAEFFHVKIELLFNIIYDNPCEYQNKNRYYKNKIDYDKYNYKPIKFINIPIFFFMRGLMTNFAKI